MYIVDLYFQYTVYVIYWREITIGDCYKIIVDIVILIQACRSIGNANKTTVVPCWGIAVRWH